MWLEDSACLRYGRCIASARVKDTIACFDEIISLERLAVQGQKGTSRAVARANMYLKPATEMEALADRSCKGVDEVQHGARGQWWPSTARSRLSATVCQEQSFCTLQCHLSFIARVRLPARIRPLHAQNDKLRPQLWQSPTAAKEARAPTGQLQAGRQARKQLGNVTGGRGNAARAHRHRALPQRERSARCCGEHVRGSARRSLPPQRHTARRYQRPPAHCKCCDIDRNRSLVCPL